MDEQKRLENYLEFRIPVKKCAEWTGLSQAIRSALKTAGIPINWQWRFHHHMTILYLDNNKCVDRLTPGFVKCLSGLSAFLLNIDKVDAFTTGNGAEHIVCLTTTQIPSQVITLAQDTRTLADSLGVDYDHRPFKCHITLGRIPADRATLTQVQAALATVTPPAITCPITEAEHRYRGGTLIKNWKLSK